MSMKLVLVESPAKAATLGPILGPDYMVETVAGPVRDFPQDYVGAGEGAPPPREAFVVSEKRRAAVAALAAKAARCAAVFLAHDPTWEGEAAAWNLREALSGAGCHVPARRVCLASLAPEAVRRAFEKPGDIDMNLVDAYIVRRVLDRIVAFRIGPFVWKNVQRGLPASRLQVALLRQIRAEAGAAPAVPGEWVVEADSRLPVSGKPLPLKLVAINGEPASFREEAPAAEIRATLERCALVVASCDTIETTHPSPPPFTTDTLLQSAADLFSLPPARVLAAAQKLYEGVDIGTGGPVGLITYPISATSSVPRDDARGVRAYIRKRFGPRYVAGGTFSTVSADAVCAIRPIDTALEPESLRDKLDPVSFRVYALIWRRFVASQMAPSKVDETTLLVNATGAPKAYRFAAVSRTVTFRGHRIVSDTIDPHPEISEPPLPALEPGAELEPAEWTCRETPPTPRPPCTETALTLDVSRQMPTRIPAVLAALAALRHHECIAPSKPGEPPSATETGARLSEYLADVFPTVFSEEAYDVSDAALDAVATGVAAWDGPVADLDGIVRDAVDVALSPPKADPDKVAAVVDALDSIVNWEPPTAEGRHPGGDEAFYRAMRAHTAAEGGEGLTERDYEKLLKLIGHYRAQIPSFVELVRRIGRFDLLELPDNAPDIKTIRAKMEWVDKAPLSPESKRFVDSLKHQADSGRRLTGAQVRVLDDILAAQALRIPGLTPDILKELGITPRTKADIDKIQKLLDTLCSIKQWRPPSQRGKRTYDDRAFTASVRDQFDRRGDLSPAQLNAVKRMVARYHGQIENYAEIAREYELPPEGLEPPMPGRRRRKPVASPAAPTAPATPAPANPNRNPVEDL